jgi:hypothetical protein
MKPAVFFYIIFFSLFTRSLAQPDKGGAYAGIDLQVSSVNQGPGLIIGFSGGYQTKNGLIIGGELYDLLNGTPFPNQDNTDSGFKRKSKMHFGGIVLGYEFGSSPETRFRYSTTLGIGDISAYENEKGNSLDGSIYFVAQPKVSVSFFSSNNLHLILNTGYRFHIGVDTPGTSDSLLNGAFLGISGEYTWKNNK